VALLAAAGIDPTVTPIFGAQNIGHQIVVLPDGRLVNVSQASGYVAVVHPAGGRRIAQQ
jgi:S-adenosylhomocysteine hydrolase